MSCRMMMSDPRKSAHFVNIAKLTPKVSWPTAEGGLHSVSTEAFMTSSVPSPFSAFSLTHWSCGANEITVVCRERIPQEKWIHWREDPILWKKMCYGLWVIISRQLVISSWVKTLTSMSFCVSWWSWPKTQTRFWHRLRIMLAVAGYSHLSVHFPAQFLMSDCGLCIYL